LKEITLTSFVAFGIRSEGNDPKNLEQQSVSPSRQCSSAPVGFGQSFLNKEQCDNAGATPTLSWPGSSWFYLLYWLKSELRGRRFC